MATYTPNLNLKKPAGTDNVNIADINTNMDTIDANIHTILSGTCATAAATAAKVVVLSGFVLEANEILEVVFANVNTVAAATLNVNSTGAIAVYCNGSVVSASQMPKMPLLQYDGTYWQLLNPVADTYFVKLREVSPSSAAAAFSIDLSTYDMTQYRQLIIDVQFNPNAAGSLKAIYNDMSANNYFTKAFALASSNGNNGNSFIAVTLSASGSFTMKNELMYNPDIIADTQTVLSHSVYGIFNNGLDGCVGTGVITLTAGITKLTYTVSAGTIPTTAKFIVYGVRK